MTSFTGKTALVTGGTRGIGFAIARALSGRGMSVFICGRSSAAVRSALDSLSSEIAPRSTDKLGRVRGAACDVRSYADVQGMMEAVANELGGPDVLINNAGVGMFANVQEMADQDWRATLETNLSGVFYCCKEAIPLMKRRGGGYIINIGSLAGKNAFVGGAAYNASKFGLIGFSEALMQEVRYDGIRVSYIMPGSVNTAFGRHGEEDPATTWKLLPNDIAEVVVDLLSTNSRALASRVEIRPSSPRK